MEVWNENTALFSVAKFSIDAKSERNSTKQINTGIADETKSIKPVLFVRFAFVPDNPDRTMRHGPLNTGICVGMIFI